jgi:eukaryotic-like serine/threonine-protein kinase
VRTATGERRKLFDGDAVQPHWSPRGDRIAFWASYRPAGGQRDLWMLAATGGTPTRVTQDAAVDWNPVWSPDARHLYFLSDRGGTMNIWRVAIDEGRGRPSGAPQPVTAPAASVTSLSFAADGRRLGFVSVGHPRNVEAIPFDAARGVAAGPSVPVTSGSRAWQTAALSPDGESVALQSGRPAQEDIFVMGVDGSGLRQLTNDAANDRRPRWSPDGRQIAFYSNRGGAYGIWIVNRDGGGLRKLKLTADGPLGFPAWSPDGSRLVFTAPGKGESRRTFVTAVSAEPQPEPLPAPPNGIGFDQWLWSPDGKRLAGFPNPGPGIWLYSLETREYRRVSDKGFRPHWLRDGRRMLYLDAGKVFVLDLTTKATREVYAPAEGVILDLDITAANDRLFIIRHVPQADVWMLTAQ